MFYLAWAITLVASFWLGYHIRDITKKVEVLEQTVKAKIDKPKISDLPQSTIIDPGDEVQTAIYEHNQMMARLNPDE